MLQRIGEAVECLFEDHKFVRRSSVYIAWGLIVYATQAMFGNPEQITGASATAYASVCGLLSAVIGLYQWDRTREDTK